jgi:hypothetical protein
MEFQNSYEILFYFFFQYRFVRKKIIIIVLSTDFSSQKFVSPDLISTALSTALVRTDNKKTR